MAELKCVNLLPTHVIPWAQREAPEIRRAFKYLKSTELPFNEGPYADPNRTIARLASQLSGKREPRNLGLVLEQLEVLYPSDMLPFDALDSLRLGRTTSVSSFEKLEGLGAISFLLNQDTCPSDYLPNAGEVLDNQQRRIETLDGGRMLGHEIEMYLVVIAILRRCGFNVYPCHIYTPPHILEPKNAELQPYAFAISIFTDNDNLEIVWPNRDLSATRSFGSATVSIINDVAMMGACHAVHAKYLAGAIALDIIETKDLSQMDLVPYTQFGYLAEMANHLVAAHVRWPDCIYCDQTMSYSTETLVKAFYFTTLSLMRKSGHEMSKEQQREVLTVVRKNVVDIMRIVTMNVDELLNLMLQHGDFRSA